MKLDTLPGAGRQGGWERGGGSRGWGWREEEEEAGDGRDSFIDRGNKHLLSSENTIEEREREREKEVTYVTRPKKQPAIPQQGIRGGEKIKVK